MTLKLKPMNWGGIDYPSANCPITGQEFSLRFEEGAFWASWDLNLPGSNDLESLKQKAEDHRLNLVLPHVEEEELAMANFDPATLPEEEKDQVILDLQAQVSRLSAILENRAEEVNLVSFVNGVVELEGTPVAYMAEFLAQLLEGQDKSNPANYVEMSITNKRLGELVMTLQRKSGFTPHQFRKKAEAEVAAFKSRLKAEVASADREIMYCDQALQEGAIDKHEHSVRMTLLRMMKDALVRVPKDIAQDV